MRDNEFSETNHELHDLLVRTAQQAPRDLGTTEAAIRTGRARRRRKHALGVAGVGAVAAAAVAIATLPNWSASNSIREGASGHPQEVTLRCDGKTPSVDTTTVQAQRDGVHVRVVGASQASYRAFADDEANIPAPKLIIPVTPKGVTNPATGRTSDGKLALECSEFFGTSKQMLVNVVVPSGYFTAGGAPDCPRAVSQQTGEVKPNEPIHAPTQAALFAKLRTTWPSVGFDRAREFKYGYVGTPQRHFVLVQGNQAVRGFTLLESDRAATDQRFVGFLGQSCS